MRLGDCINIIAKEKGLKFWIPKLASFYIQLKHGRIELVNITNKNAYVFKIEPYMLKRSWSLYNPAEQEEIK